jgi:hypothetical protein
MVEEALIEAAPDLKDLIVEEDAAATQAAPVFVPLQRLSRSVPVSNTDTVAAATQ